MHMNTYAFEYSAYCIRSVLVWAPKTNTFEYANNSNNNKPFLNAKDRIYKIMVNAQWMLTSP